MAQANRKPEAIEVGKADLPLSCPGPKSDVASLHPRVFILLKNPGDSTACPYCGTLYARTD